MSTQDEPHRIYLFDDFTLDVDRGALLQADADVKLRPKSFDVLCYLVQRHGRLVTRAELLESIWGRTVVGDDAITQCLIDIRKVIGDPDHTKIRTVPRRGYLFDIPVELSSDPGIAPRETTKAAADVHRRRTLIAGVVAILLVTSAIWWSLDKGGKRLGGDSEIDSTNASRSIAVLPFLDMSPHQDQEYFADGISEEILNLLTRVPDLKVIARTSSFAFKGEKSDIAQIADRLNVTHVLEGSIRKSDDRIRVTAQLVDASTSEHIWSDTYDRTLDDIFAIQDDVAAIVVGELKSRLLDRLPASRRTDPEAYALFLRARSLVRAGDGRNDLAESLLRQALKIDPDYAPAWTTLALVAYFQTSPNDDTTWIKYSRSEGEQLWKTALERAYALDPMDGLANTYFGWRLFFNGNDLAGVRMQEVAVTREPSNSEVLRVSGAFARYIGQWDDAIALGQRSVDVDPLCQMCYWNLTYTLLFAGRLEEAEVIARKSTTLLERGWHNLGMVLLLKGDAEAALRAFDRLETDEIDGWTWRHGRALALHSLGRSEESRENLAAFIESSGKYTPRLISAAQVYAWIGDSDSAFETLESMSHADREYRRATFLTGAAWHPLYRNLHDHPRWQAYWELAQTTPEELQAIEFDVHMPVR